MTRLPVKENMGAKTLRGGGGGGGGELCYLARESGDHLNSAN